MEATARRTQPSRLILAAAAVLALSPLGAWAQRVAPVNVGGIAVVPAAPHRVSGFKAFLDTPGGREFLRLYPAVLKEDLTPGSIEGQLFVGALDLPPLLSFERLQTRYLQAQETRSRALARKIVKVNRDLAQGRTSPAQAEAAARQARAELAELPGLGGSVAADIELEDLEAGVAAARELELQDAAGRALEAAKAPGWQQSASVGGDAAAPIRRAALAAQATEGPAARLSPWVERGMVQRIVQAIDSAQDEIEIAHPGVPLAPEIRAALARAAAKGRTVRLISEWSEETAPELRVLERAGIQIRRLPGTPSHGTPSLHAKFAVIGGQVWFPRPSVSGEYHWSAETDKAMLSEFSIHMNAMWNSAAADTPAAAPAAAAPQKTSGPQPAAPAKKGVLETLADWHLPFTVVAGLAAAVALAPAWGAAVIPAALFAITMGMVGIAVMNASDKSARPLHPLERILPFVLLGGASALSPLLFASASVAQWVIAGAGFGLAWLASLE